MEKMEISEQESKMLGLIEKLIAAGVERGIEKGLEKARSEERLREKITYDIKLKNTRLLIKNYRKFIKACEQATCTEHELETATVDEILDKLYCTAYDEVTVVQSILASKKRTEIIIEHIKRIIKFYVFDADNSKNNEKIRRAHIIEDLYINGKSKPKISEMSEKYHISERQIGRDQNAAIEEIAIFMFGIDGIRKMF
ncbi:MAG: hypothetical protein IJE05_01860 [Clostridia bacterium]|nr:hypothetical protein [Clostridia bacterium]